VNLPAQSSMNVAVTHNEARQRFEATVEGHLCVADYQLRGDVLWMTHTGVPTAVGGRGTTGSAELGRKARTSTRRGAWS